MHSIPITIISARILDYKSVLNIVYLCSFIMLFISFINLYFYGSATNFTTYRTPTTEERSTSRLHNHIA